MLAVSDVAAQVAEGGSFLGWGPVCVRAEGEGELLGHGDDDGGGGGVSIRDSDGWEGEDEFTGGHRFDLQDVVCVL